MRWDPVQYQRFADERTRSYHDLVGRIFADNPGSVVDLGCGSGDQTVTLRDRWPGADLLGVDSSAEMLAKAPPGLKTRQQDATDFDATGTDVLISNAMLQWVPDHDPLLERWAGQLNPGGWLAFQVPDNFDSPSHALMRELAESPAWADRLHGVLRHGDAVSSPGEYADLLATAGLRVDAWRTTYEHILPGDDPVLEWVKGTGLRPVLQALTDGADRDRFVADYAASLRRAYPQRSYGTVLSFSRVFAVGQKPPI